MLARRFLACAVLLLALSGVSCAVEPASTAPLTELYTPSFPPPPPAEEPGVTARKLIERVRTPVPPGSRSALIPSQSGILWIALLVTVAVGFDLRNLRNPRNIDLLILQAIGWCFYDILYPLDAMRDPTARNLMDWTFTAIVGLTIVLLVRALRRVYRRDPGAWRPDLPTRTVAVIAIGFVLADAGMALYSPPDDAGYFINIGGQRLRERLRWPYGDPLLTGTPAAAYGPVLYAAHVPFQLLLSPRPVNLESPPRPLIESGQTYYLPPLLATKLCTLAFHLLGVWALFAAARRLAGPREAWGLVALYCSSVYVLGVGDGAYSIGGITFTSHIAPAAVTLLAFALLHRPAWSGVAVAAAIGSLFYPVFMVPAWVGYYWRRKADLRRFLVGFGLTSLLIGGAVVLQSRPAHGRGRIATILYDTVGHQESPEAYGSSPFGFWGQRGGVRGWLMNPVVAGQSMTRPVVLVFFGFAAAMFFVAQGRAPAQFALVIAAVAMGAQLWKVHATATYVTWYFPFLLIGLLSGTDVSSDAHD